MRIGIVSSSEEDEGEMHVGIVPSSASDDDDYVDRENFKSDEFNAPEPPPRNEIQWCTVEARLKDMAKMGTYYDVV